MKDDELIEKYARLMGMKPEEVLEVVPGHDGARVRTHDGAWTHVRDDGTTDPAEAPEVTHERDSGVAEPDAKNAPAAKNAPKGRGQA